MASIVLDEVGRTFGETVALDQVTLEILRP